jgi:hypothetical protein
MPPVRITVPTCRPDTSLPEPERDRLSRRNFYRIIDRFGGRRDLLIAPDARLLGSHPAD